MSSQVLRIHPNDNVLVALTDLLAGDAVSCDGVTYTIKGSIPAKHKVAMHDMSSGAIVTMYGVTIGKTTRSIQSGEAIGTHNLHHEASPYYLKDSTYSWITPDTSRWKDRTFLGYHRADGQVGIANYWLLVPLVFCENRNIEHMRKALELALGYQEQDRYADFVNHLVGEHLQVVTSSTALPQKSGKRLFPQVDGIRTLLHEGGCGGTRQDADTLCSLLAGYIHNPNVAGATVFSLGCQHAEINILQKKLSDLDPNRTKPVIILDQQQAGTEQALMEEAIRLTFAGLKEANKLQRKPAPLSKLVVGLKCGGSDGFSGISANPAIGHASDLLVALGGSTILSEFPELCGVEQNLIDRCQEPADAKRFIDLMQAYSRAAVAAGSGFDMNPSPGNIKDGLITDAMKSAGAARKGGTAPVADVLPYGTYLRKAGLNLLCTPGNDVESTTGTTGSGAQIILFTTGLGTPTGNPVSHVVKLSTNSRLAERMPDIIDFDCGAVIRGEKTIEEVGEEILEYLIAVASGQQIPKAVQLRQYDFIPWKRGVSL
ncbi:MAG: altronate dehydratase family protein [Cyclobacteriaceae bacterium]|nr:altronate dehydratase family protein [Cyclobacteriaceae bacterium]HQQ81771.1 altronate dehydratase family protein [Cyclobacteriaceae bacterium]